jgi:hypothetical protein
MEGNDIKMGTMSKQFLGGGIHCGNRDLIEHAKRQPGLYLLGGATAQAAANAAS